MPVVPSPSEPTLRQAWQDQAPNWLAWVRRPGHDSFDRFHRDLFLPLLPAPGALTLDIGCGEGRLSRLMAAAGHRVVGIDASPTLAAAAREASPATPVALADAAALPLPDGCADLAVAFMSLQDVDDMPAAVGEIARVLVPGGRLCLATVHPLNSAGAFRSQEPDSEFVLDGSYLESHRYADRSERDDLRMTFHSWHHPLTTYTRALERSGLLIEAVREPAVPEDSLRAESSRRWQRLPLFLHIRARLVG